MMMFERISELEAQVAERDRKLADQGDTTEIKILQDKIIQVFCLSNHGYTLLSLSLLSRVSGNNQDLSCPISPIFNPILPSLDGVIPS